MDLRDAGDPVEIATMPMIKPAQMSWCFWILRHLRDGRNTAVDMVRKVAERVFIPFTVGGGIRSSR